MQNLLFSALGVSVTWEVLVSSETARSIGCVSLGFFVDFTVAMIEIIIARTMRVNKIGLSVIKLSEMGKTG